MKINYDRDACQGHNRCYLPVSYTHLTLPTKIV